MNTVKVKRSDLLDKVTANRAAHREVFLRAQDGYRRAAIKKLEEMLAEARAGKRIRRSVALVAPTDQTPEYDRVIAMLEMSVDDEIELAAREFSCYVLDEWEWTQNWTATAQRYT